MTGLDQPLQARRPAVDVMWREEIDAVVAPAAIARELRHRHELDGVDAERGEVGEALDDPVKRSGGGERARVQLIKHGALERHAFPAGIGPHVRAVIDNLGQAQHAIGLRCGARVRTDLASIEREAVARAGTCAEIRDLPPASITWRHRDLATVSHQIDPATFGRPDREPVHQPRSWARTATGNA